MWLWKGNGLLIARGLAQRTAHCPQKCIFPTHQDQEKVKSPYIRVFLVFQKLPDFLQAKKWFFWCFLRPCIFGNFCRFIPCNLSRPRHRAWSVREEKTYALVSCLLKFKSWISGCKATVFTDHRSLESWYREDLCTMTGPLGRRGRWHEFLSRYNIVVLYKLGKDNDVADAMSRGAYPAALADDTNFHGDVFPWGACLRVTLRRTGKQASRQSTALTGASSWNKAF